MNSKKVYKTKLYKKNHPLWMAFLKKLRMQFYFVAAVKFNFNSTDFAMIQSCGLSGPL